MPLAFSLCVCFANAQTSSFSAWALSSDSPPASPVPRESTEPPSTNWTAGITLAGGPGLKAMGSCRAHDLSTAALHVGRLLNSEGPFLHHFELGAELWTGAQSHPDTAYLVGLTPIVRYRFFPDARWTPFIDAGAGLTGTDIGRPDLSTTFEFNLQAGGGLQWKWRDNTALLVQARYIHLSNASIESPNHGVNSVLFGVGVAWFF